MHDVSALALIIPTLYIITHSAIPQASMKSRTLPPCARVITVPMFSDNYAYIVVDVSDLRAELVVTRHHRILIYSITQPVTGAAACIDPAEPSKVLAAAKMEGINLTTVSHSSLPAAPLYFNIMWCLIHPLLFMCG